MSRFYTRRMCIQIAQESEEKGWESEIEPREDVREELKFWLKNLRKVNGYRIRQKDQVLIFDSIGGSDAGDFQVGGALVEEMEPLEDSVFKFQLSEEEKKKSSTYRDGRNPGGDQVTLEKVAGEKSSVEK